MPTQPSYNLTPIANNEWSVKISGDIYPCGTIRKLSAKTFGWHDRAGFYEYSDIHTAAQHCIRYSRPRQLRQLQRAEDFRHTA